MNYEDLHHSIAVVPALTVQTIATDTTTNGEIIDRSGFEGLEFVVQTGTVTDGAYAVQIWQSDDASMTGAVQVAGDELLGNADLVAADDDATKRIGTLGKQRYQQVRIVSTDTTSGGSLGAVAIKAGAKTKPVAD